MVCKRIRGARLSPFSIGIIIMACCIVCKIHQLALKAAAAEPEPPPADEGGEEEAPAEEE